MYKLASYLNIHRADRFYLILQSYLILVFRPPTLLSFIMSSNTVGFAGITAKFAQCVVRHLLKNPGVTIRGYCRDPSKLPAVLLDSPRVSITQGQFDDQKALQSFVRGNDVVVCCYLGDYNLMVNGQKALIDACESEGVARYVASDYTVDFTKLDLGQHPAKDPMKHVQEYLKTKNVEGVHVLIGVFMETFFSTYFGCWQIEHNSFSYWGTGEEMWESTSYDNAAQFVAAVTQDTSAVGVQRCTYNVIRPSLLIILSEAVLGDRKNIKQIAAAFETQYGTKPSLNRLGSLEDLYTHMHQVRNNDPSNFMAWFPL